MPIEMIFFDIGGTLGERDNATGQLVPFPSTHTLLTAIRDKIKVKMGIITTLGSLSNKQGRDLVARSGLAEFFDPLGFVSEHDVNGDGKPNSVIYQFAARAVGIRIDRCLYISENLIEVIGAMAAGMQAVLKPCPPGRELPI